MLNSNDAYKNYIAGNWVGTEQTVAILNPANGKCIADMCLASEADVNEAVLAAKRAHDSRVLSGMRPHERSTMLHRIADALEQLKPDGSHILSMESGKRLQDAEAEFDEAVRYFRYYAGMADKLEGRSIPLGRGYIDYTVHVPYGVTAHIIPWNFPLSLAARSMAPALAAANTVVIKLPELDPIATLLLGRACEMAGVPKGCVSLLCGVGTVAGEALVGHADVQQVVFTGSVPVGQRILEKLATRVVPSVMELGGKSAAVVCEDADIDQVLSSVYWGAFFNGGQVCSALSRLLVPKEMHNELVQRIAQMIDTLSVGEGLANHDVTPVISSRQLDVVLTMCERAEADGAVLVRGGHKLDRPGFFCPPTLFANVSPESEIAQKEVFGPVLSVIPYESQAHAVRIANGTAYGLVAGVFTQSLEKAAWFVDQLEAGQIFVNEWYAGGIETPFGGMKMSGMGRDKGQEAIFNYLQTKNVAIKFGGAL